MLYDITYISQYSKLRNYMRYINFAAMFESQYSRKQSDLWICLQMKNFTFQYNWFLLYKIQFRFDSVQQKTERLKARNQIRKTTSKRLSSWHCKVSFFLSNLSPILLSCSVRSPFLPPSIAPYTPFSSYRPSGYPIAMLRNALMRSRNSNPGMFSQSRYFGIESTGSGISESGCQRQRYFFQILCLPLL